MKIWKPKLMVFTAFTFCLSAGAQVKFPVTNNGLRNDLQKVIADFPNDFSNLKGDILIENPQTIEYVSLLNFSGAEDNTITKYNASKSIYSWQATMLTTEEFSDAEIKYKWLFNQLKNMTINIGDYSFSLYGDYDQPDESRKFSTTTFRLIPGAINLPKLKIEIAMQYEFPDWKVVLQVYQKEREDNERGPITEIP